MFGSPWRLVLRVAALAWAAVLSVGLVVLVGTLFLLYGF